MNELKQLVARYASEARTPTERDKVYKDECVYSFDTPENNPHGLYVCLSTFVGVSKRFLPLHFNKSQSHLYLRIKTWRREKKSPALHNTSAGDEPEKKKPNKMAIGVDGGFAPDDKQFYFEHAYWLHVYPDEQELELRGDDVEATLGDSLRRSIEAVKSAESAAYKEELASQVAWNGEIRIVSKHSATLYQVPDVSGVVISPEPASWKCAMCDIRQNLWLNLSDGWILCGRRQMDGSGGNNHAVEHYQATKYPLAVKLGTITAAGAADVYSYDEDDMVEDTNLAAHLAHFGIQMARLEKTERTMAELEIDLNQRVGEWDRIQEVGSALKPLYGPGFTGLRNLGNSCYMNA